MSGVKPKAFKLDIFSVLTKLNSGDLHVYNGLTPEERKGFSAYVITRWLSGTNNSHQLILINELVNSVLFKLGNHPELLAKLMACCGTKSYQRFNWIAEAKKGSKSQPLSLSVIEEYFEYTTREAKYQLPLISKQDIVEMAEELGWQADELKKLKKECS